MKKIIIIISGILAIGLIGGLSWGVNYLFDYAIVRGEKEFISGSQASGGEGGAYSEWTFAKEEPVLLKETSDDGLQLVAAHFTQEQKQRPKLAIIAHGYTSEGEYMKDYGELFYELGYDLLVPDARAHGKSEGEYIGFGWTDRLDYLNWIDLMVNSYPEGVDILLYGISMGGATVMMTAGEELPDNVKLIIEDCGYDSVENELAYQLKEMFSLPSFPLIPLTSVYSDLKADYNFKEASSVRQLRNNRLPILFIHGERDTFVPYDMLAKNYAATQGPKEQYSVKGAKHATSFNENPEEYRQVVTGFINKYMK